MFSDVSNNECPWDAVVAMEHKNNVTCRIRTDILGNISVHNIIGSFN